MPSPGIASASAREPPSSPRTFFSEVQHSPAKRRRGAHEETLLIYLGKSMALSYTVLGEILLCRDQPSSFCWKIERLQNKKSVLVAPDGFAEFGTLGKHALQICSEVALLLGRTARVAKAGWDAQRSDLKRLFLTVVAEVFDFGNQFAVF